MKTSELLRAARKRIEDPKDWIALSDFSFSELNSAAVDSVYASAFILFACDPTLVRDNLGHAAVLKVYDHAIAEAEREEGK